MVSLQRLALSTFLCLCLGAAGPATAALRLAVHAELTHKALQPDAKAPPDWKRDLTVELADTFIAVHDGDKTTVYDFAHRRRLLLDEAAGTIDDGSLYAVVGFRELELRNRDGLARMLDAAKLASTVAPVFEEQELSLQRPDSPAPVRQAGGGDIVFASGGATLLTASSEGSTVGAADAAHFVQFLRYEYGGHPAILRALQDGGRIPAHLRFDLHMPGTGATLDLAIGQVRQVALPAAFATARYKPRGGDGSGTLDDLALRAWSTAGMPAPARRNAAVEAVKAALGENRPFEAFLGFSELTLDGPGPLPLFDAAQKAQLAADPSVRTLSAAMGARQPADLRRAAATLARLRMGAGAKRHVLELYEANDRAQLGERDTALALFGDVLRANPALAGAWKDLGDLYYSGFDTPRAWRCWDIARRLAPGFVNVKAIDAHEAALAARYPEYF